VAQSSLGGMVKSPELSKRILFSIAMIAIYRVGVFVPTPGINVDALQKFFAKGTVFDIFNLFSGGALQQFSVFALGIMPYISASIILQLLTVSIPSLQKLSKDGDYGRKKITQYTRYGTVVLSLIQGFGISYGLKQQGVVLPGSSGLGFYVLTVLTLACGTAFIMWLGEQISERGIGNGISLVIFSGIVARIPAAFRDVWSTQGLIGFLLVLAFVFGVIFIVIYFERSQRRIPIHYAKRIVGRKMFGGQTAHLPLKLNMAGVIPPIFASSLILFPATIAQFSHVEFAQRLSVFLSQGWFHDTLYVTLIIFFAYFYTAVTFNPLDVADNLKKNGGYIPGIRPGKATADYIDLILSRLTLGGGLYIAGICILPSLLLSQFGIPGSLIATFGGTSILIVVGVAMDTVAQMESHLLSRNYEGFLGGKSGRFKGRRS